MSAVDFADPPAFAVSARQVELGLLVTQPGDQVGDFDGVYDFAEAFGDVYQWSGVRGA